MREQRSADVLAAGVAEGQDGLITRAQARRCGLSDDQIDWRLSSGRWKPRASGVFLIAGAPWSWRQDALAACLAGPSGTVASYLTAAALHSLWEPPLLPHITVPRSSSARLRIAKAHRADLDPLDRCRIAGIPSTTAARTLVDAAQLLGRNQLADLVDDALCRKLASAQAVGASAQRAQQAPGRRGIPLLRSVLEAWTSKIEPGSPAEMRLLRLLEQWGFGPPTRQHVVRGADGSFIARLDLAYAESRIGFEYDGVRFHNPRRWAHDEPRYEALRGAGWWVTSVDKHDLLPGERALLDRLTQARARRRAA